MDELVKEISEADTRAQDKEKIIQYLPFVMYLENRVGIKILTMLLIEGLLNSVGNNIPSCNKYTIKKRKKSYLYQAGEIVSSFLGDNVKWQVPVEKRQAWRLRKSV